MKSYHIPVLLQESIDALNIKPEGTYIDATLGEAGHSIEIYKKLSEKGKLIGLDQDSSAIKYVNEKYSTEISNGNWEIIKMNFSKISTLNVKADGILMDIGLSSRQLEEKGRGFSYNNDEDLDMRMDEQLSVKASDLLKVLTARELETLFRKYGEERHARMIAKVIKEYPNISTTGELTSLIYRVVPATLRREDSHHPARRVFQALRIAVNDELNSLKDGLDGAFEILLSGGRLCVITFHSLEQRIVTDFFKSKESEAVAKILGNQISASKEELEKNNRSRSAKLNILEKI